MSDEETTSDIGPALTPDEWARIFAHADKTLDAAKADAFLAYLTRQGFAGNPHAAVALIAMANAGLHDEDPRKFTRETVRDIRSAAIAVEDAADAQMPEDGTELHDLFTRLHELADVIESYLPPEAS